MKNLNKVQSSEGARRVNISMSTAKQLQPAVSFVTEVCAIFFGGNSVYFRTLDSLTLYFAVGFEFIVIPIFGPISVRSV